eukprot:CAMPEP_0117420372 /NCGR_PEP_ID=MMETSP0758-20121206/1716_1 /TAXON_ID=63605 /ORGANISM="Percolomonas cosmopolitus, Strain AE-1 (ATCC 50343)" /LENGTH=420 /DNA_ID=CAMNT_0005201935 /DNA_START=685 /DNA_END=1944 /DNA_ORIENTATION=+
MNKKREPKNFEEMLENMQQFVDYLLTKQHYRDYKTSTLPVMQAYMRLLSRHSTLQQVEALYKQIVEKAEKEEVISKLDQEMSLLDQQYHDNTKPDQIAYRGEEIDIIDDDDMLELLETNNEPFKKGNEKLKQHFKVDEIVLKHQEKKIEDTKQQDDAPNPEDYEREIRQAISQKYFKVKEEKEQMSELVLNIHALMIHTYVTRGDAQKGRAIFESLREAGIKDIRLYEAIFPSIFDVKEMVTLIIQAMENDGLQYPTRSMIEHACKILESDHLLNFLNEYVEHRVAIRKYRKSLVSERLFETYEDTILFIREIDYNILQIANSILRKRRGYQHIDDVTKALRRADVYYSHESLYQLWISAIDRYDGNDLHRISFDDIKPLLLLLTEKPISSLTIHPSIKNKYKYLPQQQNFLRQVKSYIK